MKLTWKDNMLFIGTICVGVVARSFPARFYVYIPIRWMDDVFLQRSDYSSLSESEARTYLENFVKEQAL